ncbi:MAG: ABC transporter ATP-binding protein [Bacteroidota bacterium]
MDKLTISNLSTTYPNGVRALQDVSLTVERGMFGLLGPNGAGKSTLMRILATLQEVDDGNIQLGKLDIQTQKMDVRKVLGYLPQEFGVYPKITAEKLLHHLASLKGIVHYKSRKQLVDTLLHKVNLYAARKQQLGGFSGGMKRRFGIAQALLNQPKLLIVDEPTAGLDPSERHRFFNLLSEVSRDAIVMLSTHIVHDIEALCDDMAILHQGKIVTHGRPSQFIDALRGKVFDKTIDKGELSDYESSHRVISNRLFLGKTIIRFISETPLGKDFVAVHPSLEDVYMSQVSQNI